MSTWFEFLSSFFDKKTDLLIKVNRVYGVNHLVASYLTTDDLFNLKELNILLGYTHCFLLERVLLQPPSYHKKLTMRDKDYLMKIYKLNPHEIEYALNPHEIEDYHLILRHRPVP